MRRFRWILGACALAALPLVLAPAVGATTVTLTAGQGHGLAGQTVDIDISTTDLTGLNVLSYQFSLSYYASDVTPTAVLVNNTLTGNANWALTEFSANNGTVTVSGAGATPLTGAGVMVRIRFLLAPSLLNGGYASLSFGSILLNEGIPTASGSGGYITINPTPRLSIYPDNGTVSRGETLQFQVSAYNGNITPPVTWGTTDPNVASVDGSGLLTGLLPGAVRVFAVDHAGLTDTTSNVILVRGMRVTVPADTAYVGTTGQVTIAYDSTYLAFQGATAGTMLNGFQFSAGARNGLVTLSFAGNGVVSGSGPLGTMHFLAGHPNSGYTNLRVTAAFFNESLLAATTDGTFWVRPLGYIYLSPGSVSLLAGQQQAFTPYGIFNGPLTWSTQDSTVARVNSSGLVTALSGGVTNVLATDVLGVVGSASISVYDFQLNLPATVWGVPGQALHVPLYADRDIGGLNILSAQCTLAATDTIMTQAGADSAGLVAAWGRPQGHGTRTQVSLSAAGTLPLAHGTGTPVASFNFVVSPGYGLNRNLNLSLPAALFNEGHPRVQVGSGTLHVVGALTPFVLRSPANMDSSLLNREPTLVWQRTQTTDPADSIFYTVEWSDTVTFAHPQFASASLAGRDTTYTFSPTDGLHLHVWYYWRVHAYDHHGLEQWSDPPAGWRFYIEADTPAGLAVSAAAGGDGIVISWVVPRDLSVQGYRVYRRTADSDWKLVSSLLPAGPSTVQFTDTEALPGQTYQYEVEVLGIDGPIGRWGPVTATMPQVTAALWLRAEPNPGRGDLSLSFGLPRAGDVTVRLVDAGGREVARRNLSGLGAGNHQVHWSPETTFGARLASGAYWIRLETSAGRRTVRWVLIR